MQETVTKNPVTKPLRDTMKRFQIRGLAETKENPFSFSDFQESHAMDSHHPHHPHVNGSHYIMFISSYNRNRMPPIDIAIASAP